MHPFEAPHMRRLVLVQIEAAISLCKQCFVVVHSRSQDVGHGLRSCNMVL